MSEGPENETVIRCFYVGSAFVPQASCTGFHLFCSSGHSMQINSSSSIDMNCKLIKIYYIRVSVSVNFTLELNVYFLR